jgi:hypothetical protein
MSSERDSFAKGIFSTFAKGFLLHKLLLKVNYSPLRVKKSRSHDMGHCLSKLAGNLNVKNPQIQLCTYLPFTPACQCFSSKWLLSTHLENAIYRAGPQSQFLLNFPRIDPQTKYTFH